MQQRKHRKKRVPKLKHTANQNIGWHVSYRDPDTGTPRRHRFGMVSQEEAERQYHQWVAAHLRGETPGAKPRRPGTRLKLNPLDDGAEFVAADIVPGSLLDIASGLLRFEQSRVRTSRSQRQQGTICRDVYEQRVRFAQEFLRFLNARYGRGAVGRMQLADLRLNDIEAYNRAVVSADYSASQVTKRLQFVKAIIDRAGRPEHGGQVLPWNWDSRDVAHGKAPKQRQLPSVAQLKLVLNACKVREKAIVWLAIGCGFGQRDVAALRVGQIDKKGYDLRRGKTGVERYGDTPPMVWTALEDYLQTVPRGQGELMFVTRKGMPVVHEEADSIKQ